MLTLQNIMLPDEEICAEPDLYFRFDGPAAFSTAGQYIRMEPASSVSFDTYFNLFSAEKWDANGDIGRLFLDLTFQGNVAVSVYRSAGGRSRELVVSQVVEQADSGTIAFDLSGRRKDGGTGSLYLKVTALSQAKVFGGRFWSERELPGDFKLALSITTFRREAEVKRTIARVSDFLRHAPDAKHLGVLVVDNGGTLDLDSTGTVSILPNRNLGGAGGFSRGLIEAKARGFSHCLFMDDDASFQMENLTRTIAFLGLSDHPETAVAGAMIGNGSKDELWENGAIFNRVCRPMFSGMDLRPARNIFRLERETVRRRPEGLYGGWWYFAFPIAHVQHFPFPFFVRGDDSGFSLCNDFRIQTLNGVASFQDEFSDKESPTTRYLDLRYHLIHHLVVPHLDVGPVSWAAIAVRLVARSLARFHYETAEGELLAIKDVLAGPDFFSSNPDAADRRADLKALAADEVWKDASRIAPFMVDTTDLPNKLQLLVLKLTVNGHMVPFFGLFSKPVDVSIGSRGVLTPVWGAKAITFHSRDRDKYYHVRKSNLKFASFALRLGVTLVQMIASHARLRKSYRSAYPEITSQDYWMKVLGLDADEIGAADARTKDAAE